MLTICTSGKSSPGTTTSTWALALGWPAPLLALDADPAGGDMAPGMLCGRITMDRSLVSWSASARREAPVLESAALLAGHAVLIPEAEHVWFVPGFTSATQAEGFTASKWTQLAKSLERSNAVLGRDTLVDAGRITDSRGCWPLFSSADQILLAVRPTLRSVHGARQAAARITREIGDLSHVSLLVVGDGDYQPQEIAGSVGVPLAGTLPEDRSTAAYLADGTPLGARQSLAKSSLVKAATHIAGQLARANPATYPPAEVRT